MLFGRFLMMVPMLAIAGNLAQKKYVPPSLGTFPVTTPLFSVLLSRRDRHRGRTDLFPGVQPGTDSRTPADEGGQDFLTADGLRTYGKEKQIESNLGHEDRARRDR